jgi:hypothetical protein
LKFGNFQAKVGKTRKNVTNIAENVANIAENVTNIAALSHCADLTPKHLTDLGVVKTEQEQRY